MHFPIFLKFILINIFCTDSHVSSATILILALEIRKKLYWPGNFVMCVLSTKDIDGETNNISTHPEGITNSEWVS